MAGARATAQVFTQEILIDHAGAARRIIGAYDDTLEKQYCVWLFTSRTYRILHDDGAG